MSGQRVLTREEARRLLAVPNVRCPTGARNRAVLELLYRSGLSSGEVTGLRAGNVDLLGQRGGGPNVLVAAGQGAPREREIPLDRDSVNALRRWDRQRPKAAWWACTLKGSQTQTDYVRQVVSRCADRAGLQGGEVSPRTLRDTYACELRDEGFSEDEMMMLLGLGSRASLRRYLQGRLRSLRDRVEARPVQRGLPEPAAEDPLEALRRLPAAEQRRIGQALVALADGGEESGQADSTADRRDAETAENAEKGNGGGPVGDRPLQAAGENGGEGSPA